MSHNVTGSAAVAPAAVLSTSLPAGTAIGSTDTGTPSVTFGANLVTLAPKISAASVYASTAILNNSEYSNGTCTTSASISAANGNRQTITLTNGDTCALSFSQPASGTITVQLRVVQSTTSSYNGAISGCKWPGGAVPPITQSSGAVDFVMIYMDGTNAYCVADQNFQ